MPDTRPALDLSIRVDVPALLAEARAHDGAPFYPMARLDAYTGPVGEVLVELHAAAIADLDLRYHVTSYAPGYGDERAGINLGHVRLSAGTPDNLADALFDLGLLVLDRGLNRVGATGISIVGDPDVLAAVLATMSDEVRRAGITYGPEQEADGRAARARLAADAAVASVNAEQ